jgi:hypothetical protein
MEAGELEVILQARPFLVKGFQFASSNHSGLPALLAGPGNISLGFRGM